MADLVLQIWKIVLLGFIYLFMFRVIRAMWANLRTTTTPPRSHTPASVAPRPRKETGKTIGSLRIVEPKEQAGTLFSVEQELTIGRAPGCKILIDDTFVSQLHARVYRRENDVYLEDLGSTNGTFCNGRKITNAVLLHKGDRVRVGQTILEAVR